MTKPLEQCRIYFLLVFKDEALKIPVIKTLKFERLVERENGIKTCLFLTIPFEDTDPEPYFIDECHIDHLLLNKEDLLQKLDY